MQTLSSVAVFESHLSVTLFLSPKISEIINKVLKKCLIFLTLSRRDSSALARSVVRELTWSILYTAFCFHWDCCGEERGRGRGRGSEGEREGRESEREREGEREGGGEGEGGEREGGGERGRGRGRGRGREREGEREREEEGEREGGGGRE